MKAFFIPLLLVALLLTACDQVVEIKVPAHTPVVVNALFYSDSTWTVRVTRATAMGEDIYNWPTGLGIKNAEVTITPANGSPITLEYKINGYYTSTQKPVPGTTYDLLVNVPGEKPITASSTMPPTVEVERAYVTTIDKSTITISMEFTDVPGPTWYEFNIHGENLTNRITQTDDPDVTLVAYWNAVSDQASSLGESYLLLSDRNFDGKKKVFTVIPEYWEPNDRYKIVLRTLSADYALYRSSANQQQNIYDDPFSQPIPVYNNITNGVGIFGGLTTTIYIIE